MVKEAWLLSYHARGLACDAVHGPAVCHVLELLLDDQLHLRRQRSLARHEDHRRQGNLTVTPVIKHCGGDKRIQSTRVVECSQLVDYILPGSVESHFEKSITERNKHNVMSPLYIQNQVFFPGLWVNIMFCSHLYMDCMP